MYKKIEALLEETNKTAYQLSKDTGVSQTALSNCKKGRSKLGLDSISRVAKYFNKPIEYFLDE